MRKKIVAANWKMNLLQQDAATFMTSLSESSLSSSTGLDVVIFPPSIYIENLITKNAADVRFGAQNAYFKESGAYTGEVSFSQLKSIGCSVILIGHSERRTEFSESPSVIKKKIDAALVNNFDCILCIGESLSIREMGAHLEFLKNQLLDSIEHLNENQVAKISIAYEPIWAIGTGLTATVHQVNEVHDFLRGTLIGKFPEAGNNVRILYGGSCNEENANELFACLNVDGGLIGGASLDVNKFLKIIHAANEVSRIEH